VRNRNIVALISDVLFVISWSLALLGLIFRFLNLTFAAIVLLEPVASGAGALFLSCNPRQKQTIEQWVTKSAWSVFRGHAFLVWT